jgi:autotransporter-associated beta strand protein
MFVGFWRHAAFIAATLLFSSTASAASIWTGVSGIDNNWNTALNWSGGVPAANADLVFPAASSTSSNNNIPSLQINSLTISGSNYAFTGNSLTLGSAAPGSGNVVLNTNAANNSAAFDIALAGGAGNTQSFTVNFGAALTLGGQLSGNTGVALTKQGAGTLILAGDNSFTGPFTINSGIVRIQHASSLGANTLAATINTNSQLQLNNVPGAIAKNLVLNGPGPSSDGALLNLAGANTLSGGIILDSDTTIGAAAGSIVLNGLVSDSGAGHNLTIAGNGVIGLSRADGNTYRGLTTINGGALTISNTSGSATGTGSVVINSGGTLGGSGSISGIVTVNSGGHVAPGNSVESLDVGSLVLNIGSILDFDLGAPGSPGINSDLINVTSPNGLTLNGGSVALTNAGGLVAGTYRLIDYAGMLGGLVAKLGTPTGPAGFSYALVNNVSNSSVDLTVTATALAGDYNNNGVVDAADYVVWRKGLGTTYTQNDYDVWRAHFGQTAGSGSGAVANAAVPEPATLLQIFLAAAVATIRRRLCAVASAKTR